MSRESSELEDELPPLEASDAMSRMGNDARHVYTPPPRISARLSVGNRRRSSMSAASSRRNSLSSTKSTSSSVRASYRRGSNHVAQHLRRASIIETRKARLAERAAHVEEVRLRAANVKAERISNTQERTLAAQQARESHLAKVAAACAEEVNHAKRVAEEMKERKAAEEQRIRQKMEEKHAEAEKRALEIKRASRKPRTASIPSNSPKKSVDSIPAGVTAELSRERACLRIQRAWKQRKRRLTLKDFSSLDLSIDRIRHMGFMEASALLADTGVIASAARILILYGLNPDDAAGDMTFVRRFLSAYMILGHPTDIFNKQGQQEQNLIEMAKELLISFEAALAYSSTSPDASTPPAASQTLSQAHASYLSAFAAWKTRDASVLIGTMVDQFVALDDIWQSVKDDTRGEVANDYRDGIRNQQVILLSKIKKLAGPEEGNTLIKRAIRESRRTRARQRPLGDARPRPIAPPDAGSTGPNAATAASELNSQDATLQPSPQSLETGELSRIFSVVPHNRVLIHELQIDPSYRIEVSPHSDLRNALNREVCNRMRTAVHDGNGGIWTLAVADNISKRLLKLVKPGNATYRMIAEVMDLDRIRQEVANDSFSYDNFFTFMADLLPGLCAPIRDAEIQGFAGTLKSPSEGVDAMIEKLFGLLHIIDLMSLDYTNYMVQQAAPTLIREADGYEQRMFAQDMSSGVVTLDKTKRWWRHATVSVLTDQGSHQQPGQVDFRRIYARGLVDLAISLGPLRVEDVPETLALDQDRFVRIRGDILRITAVGAILLTAKNLLKRDVRSQWKPEAKRIMESLKAADNFDNSDGNLGMRIGAIVETSHGMPQSSRDQLAGVIGRFLAECRAARITDPVLKLLFQRLKMHVYNRVAASTSQERVRVASTASEGLAGIGLCEFIGQVSDISQVLVRVHDVDVAAHKAWYVQVEEELMRMGAAEA